MAKRKAPAAFKKKFAFSEELAELTGKSKGTRAEATKWIWVYIKANNLNDPEEYSNLADGREIYLDEKMKAFVGKGKKVHMMKLAGALSPHLSEI